MLNNKGQTGAWEGLIILVLIVVIAVVGYYEFTKKDSTSIFKDHSQSVSPTLAPHLGGCAIVKEYVYADPINSAK